MNKFPLHRYAALYTVMGDLSKSHSEESIDRLTSLLFSFIIHYTVQYIHQDHYSKFLTVP